MLWLKQKPQIKTADQSMAAAFSVFSSEDSSPLLARDSFRHSKRRRAEAAAEERPLVLANVRCVWTHCHPSRHRYRPHKT